VEPEIAQNISINPISKVAQIVKSQWTAIVKAKKSEFTFYKHLFHITDLNNDSYTIQLNLHYSPQPDRSNP